MFGPRAASTTCSIAATSPGSRRGCARELVWNEAENSLNSGGNPYRGFDAVLEGVFQPTLRDFDRFECNLESLIDGGDTIVGTGRYRGTYKETGKRLSAQFCHVLHFDSQARLDRVQEYTDTLAEAEVAGRLQPIAEIKIPHPAM